MFQRLLRWINRRCPVCRVRIEGEGVRQGFRMFCSLTHLKEYVQQQEIKRQELQRVWRNRGGGCC